MHLPLSRHFQKKTAGMISSTVTQYFNCEGKIALKIFQAYNRNKSCTASCVNASMHINLFIKLCPLLVKMYCSDCLQQKRSNENPLLARISQGRDFPHPYVCDVKSSFDFFIKPGLNSALP